MLHKHHRVRSRLRSSAGAQEDEERFNEAIDAQAERGNILDMGENGNLATCCQQSCSKMRKALHAQQLLRHAP